MAGVGVAPSHSSTWMPCSRRISAAVSVNSSAKNRVSCPTISVGFALRLQHVARDGRRGQAHVCEGKIFGDDRAPA